MIGQKTLCRLIDIMTTENTFPRFAIITGAKGSGKKKLTDIIAQKLGVQVCYHSKIGVSDVREAISKMYKVGDSSLFTFYDVDEMSLQAKNALLKVAEEPPNNVYIIMTVTDLNNVLDTIKSRAFVYHMQPYNSAELLQYAHEVKHANYDDSLIIQLCETPGDIDLLYERDAEALCEYAYKAIDNIAVVSGSNAFKMANQIDFKGDGEGFDMKLFLKAFMYICTEYMIKGINKNDQETIDHYKQGLTITCSILNQYHITGINKVALFDMWILDIRKAWM